MLRESRSLSQRDLAGLLQIDVMQISRYERGLSIPSAETVVKLAQVLRLSVDEILIGHLATIKAPEFRDVRLLERLRALDQMPKDEREMALQVIDAIVYKSRAAEMLREPAATRP